MKEKFIFIVNPKAGKNNNAVTFMDKIKAAIKAHKLDGEIYITRSVGDAKEYVKKRCESLEIPTRFYACGGDGTLNEVINGAVGCPLAYVGILPLGSGNDYIKSFNDVDFLDLTAQINGKPKPVDLVKIGDRYVANMCNIGFDASVAHNFTKFKTVPGVSGKSAYAISVFYTLVQKLSRPMHIILDDGTEIFDDMLLCSVSKGIYCGGQYKTAPRADVSDGFIDVCPIKKLSRIQFVNFIGYYKKGVHFDMPSLSKYVAYHKCKKATIKNANNIPVTYDGEPGFINGNVTFEVAEKAVSIIIPAPADETEKEVKKEAAEIF
ncbi:MAG: diacylglycerol kinase family lipid kinase [Ruminococcaceae bacterium]|nr:diacylglycerol kinase family lipid kinase [Oscillospiraceae bacterium]